MSNFTKDDYMKLSKERLAEMLVERDNETTSPSFPINPYFPTYPYDGGTGNAPCWSEDGWCSNPHHDCFNCPGKQYKGNWTTTFSSNSHNFEDNDRLNGVANDCNNKQSLND